MALTEDQLRRWFLTTFPHRNWHHLCQAFVFRAAEATGGAGTVYQTATDALRASTIVSGDSSAAPPGAVHYWSFFTTINGVHKDFGHVGVSLGGGRCAMSTTRASDWGVNAGTVSVSAWTRDTGLAYVGWTNSNGANRIHLLGALTATQRQVLATTAASRRIGVPSTAAPKGDPLPAGTVGNFAGWVHGEPVGGNDVWFQGISGDFFWSGAFVDGPRIDGLRAISLGGAMPAAAQTLQPTQRRVLASGAANRRIGAPVTTAPTGEALPAGTVGNFTGWVTGEAVAGNAVWFVGISGNYFWSGGLEGGQNTSGLAALDPVPVSAPGLSATRAPGS